MRPIIILTLLCSITLASTGSGKIASVDYDSIVQEIVHQNDMLRMRNDSLHTLLSTSVSELRNQESHFANINTYFIILGIIISSITVFLPSLTYLYGVRPAKEEIKNLKQKVYDYIGGKNNELVDYTISKLNTGNESEKLESVRILSNLVDYEYSESDIKSIIAAYTNAEEPQTKMSIKQLLSGKESLNAERFFRQLLKEEEYTQNIYYVLRYMYNTNADILPEIVIGLSELEKPIEGYSTLVLSAASVSRRMTEGMLNEERLIEAVVNKADKKDVVKISRTFSIAMQNLFDQESYLATQFGTLAEKAKLTCEEEDKKMKAGEEKDAAGKQSKDDEDKKPTIAEIVMEAGLRKDSGKIVDNAGEVYEVKDMVYTLLGCMEVRKMIKYKDRHIDITNIE